MKLITKFLDGSEGVIEGDAEFIDKAINATDMGTVDEYKVVGGSNNNLTIFTVRVHMQRTMEIADTMWAAAHDVGSDIYWEQVVDIAQQMSYKGLYISRTP